ncbi:MAG: TetR/AcrR family transcriptional regulator [Thermodesulfobacteriota bacterium]
MTKNTFKSLPHEKKERLLETAAKLFAEKGFHQTDMAQIAAKAGVAKGSLYNYFDSKDDLYLEVCRHGLEKSRRAVYGGLDPEGDVYRQIEHIFRQGAPFALAHPEYIRLYLNVSSAGMERFAEKLSREVEKYTADHLKKILKDGLARGQVRPDLDVNAAAFTINGLYILFLVSLVSRHFQVRMKEYLEIEGEFDRAAVEAALERIIAVISDYLRPVGAGDPGLDRGER